MQQAAPAGTCGRWARARSCLQPRLPGTATSSACTTPAPFLFGGWADAHPQAGHPGPKNSSLLGKRLRVAGTEPPGSRWVEGVLTQRTGFQGLPSLWEQEGCHPGSRAFPGLLRSSLPAGLRAAPS